MIAIYVILVALIATGFWYADIYKRNLEKEHNAKARKLLGGYFRMYLRRQDIAARLRYLKYLTELDLSTTRIRSKGLTLLKSFANLEKLNLSNTRINDKAIVHLASLTKLKWLNIRRTRITDQGLAKLQKAFPKCKILH